MSAAPVLELGRVTKRFGRVTAVDDVSFAVAPGECYGLIGPNGAGKTTTFSMLCGYLYPTTGRVRVLGGDPTAPGALKGKVGVLPQDALLPPAWPVGELLTYLARLSGLEAPEREARAALERVQLPETWRTPAGALSHGMAKRVALAQALMGSPPLVLLDEPTAGLDPKVAASVRAIVRDLKRAHTVVVSSHNLNELEELCDGTAILDRGRLVSASSLAELTGRHAEFRVRVVRGEPPWDELRALPGCLEARAESPGILLVRFDGATTTAEALITATVALLAQRGVLLTDVWRGQRLEQRVLELTDRPAPATS